MKLSIASSLLALAACGPKAGAGGSGPDVAPSAGVLVYAEWNGEKPMMSWVDLETKTGGAVSPELGAGMPEGHDAQGRLWLTVSGEDGLRGMVIGRGPNGVEATSSWPVEHVDVSGTRAVVRCGDISNQVCWRPLDGAQPMQLLVDELGDGHGALRPIVWRDGRYLGYLDDGQLELIELDVATGALTTLRTIPNIGEAPPTGSSDLATIAWVETDPDRGTVRLAVIATIAPTAAPRYLPLGAGYLGRCEFLADDVHLMCTVEHDEGVHRLVVVDLGTGAVREVADQIFPFVVASPDGSRIAFSAGTPAKLMIAPVTGGPVEPVLADGPGDQMPVGWLP